MNNMQAEIDSLKELPVTEENIPRFLTVIARVAKSKNLSKMPLKFFFDFSDEIQKVKKHMRRGGWNERSGNIKQYS